jgi:CBS domain-containing protein
MTGEPLTIRDLVKRQAHGGIFYITPDLTVRQAAGALQSHGVSAIAVMTIRNGEPHLVGIVSEKDIARLVLCGDDPTRTTVESIMAVNLVTVDIDTSLWATARYMLDNNIRHLPVLDENGKPCTTISIRDVLSLIVETLGAGNEHFSAGARLGAAG